MVGEARYGGALALNSGKSGEEVDFMMGQMLSIYFRAPALYEVMQTDAPWQFHSMISRAAPQLLRLMAKATF